MKENINEELYISKKFIVINNSEKFEIRSIMGDKKYQINKRAYTIIESIQNKKLDDYNSDEKIFITNLLNAGILTKEKKLSGNHNIKKDKLNQGLDRIFLEITRKCNLYCKHCYNSSSMQSEEEGALTTLEIKKLIQKADQMGVWQFDITGGEPWLRKDLFEILAYAQEYGMVTTLFSNLTLMSEKDIECLKNFNVKKIVTSLDAYSSELHDEFRGKRGALKKTITNIKLLKQYDIPVTVNTMVGEHNINELNDLIDYLNLELEVPYVVDVIMPVGRGKVSDTEEAYFETLPYLRTICGTKERCILGTKGNNADLENNFCGIGNSLMYISYNGNANLCPSLDYRVDKKFFFGNIRKTGLQEIWNNIHNQYGDIVGMECKQCDKFARCRGGCRSKAYHMNGDISAKDIVACKTFEDIQNV